MGRKIWSVSGHDKDIVASLAAECGIDPFVSLVLNSRGFDTAEKIDDFFNENGELESPFALCDMDKCVECIMDAIENNEKICVYGDYDADGVTATAVVYSYLEAQGADVMYFIPSRMIEGYGLCVDAVEKLAYDGVKLIITVDNGVSAYDAAQRAQELGVKLCITDHHRPGERLPVAQAVVDPYRLDDESKFKDLAGVGIAFKLVTALEGGDYSSTLDDFADIVTIGTIADICPLVDENRILCAKGIAMLNETHRLGLIALKERLNITDKPLNSMSIAFLLAPRINAAGRMENAECALKLLLCDDEEETAVLAAEIDALNDRRFTIEKEILEQVEDYLEEHPQRKLDRILVVDGCEWHQGVIGIVASRLVEKYGRPVIVISREADNVARASGRSVEGFSLFAALSALSDMLIHFGGHTLAAGFSISNDMIDPFREAINEYASKQKVIQVPLNIDIKLNPAKISPALATSIEQLEPFGAGNPQPLFGLYSMQIQSIKPVGNGKHLIISATRGETYVNAVKFGSPPETFPYQIGDKVDFAIRLEMNEYKGETRVSIQIKEIRLAGADDEKVIYMQSLYEKIKRTEEIDENERVIACPTRELAGKIYRFIKEKQPFFVDGEILTSRLGLSEDEICKVLVSLDAMCELGILTRDVKGAYTAPNLEVKSELANSKLLARLRY